jgi:hypothetical protein
MWRTLERKIEAPRKAQINSPGRNCHMEILRIEGGRPIALSAAPLAERLWLAAEADGCWLLADGCWLTADG